ncbi:MAG: hypothetical protein DRO88_05905, partial [Promethearchaeia archaeon]
HKYEITASIYARDRSNTEFVKTEVFQTDLQGLTQFFGFVRKYRPLIFAMEATGIYHHSIVQFLEEQRKIAILPISKFVTTSRKAQNFGFIRGECTKSC